MKTLYLILTTFVVAFHGTANSAYIPTYLPEEDIQNNVIEQDSIEGLLPPKPRAQDHYKLQSETPGVSYVVEISRKYLKLRTSGFPTQAIKLTEKETEGVQKLSVAFVDLLYDSILSSKDDEEEVPLPDWRETNPLIFLNHSGLYLQFLNEPEEDTATVETSDSERKIVWDFLTKFAKNLLQAKLIELNVTEKITTSDSPLSESEQSSDFRKFIDTLWRIMRVSVDYAETVVNSWTSPPETTTAPVEEKTRLTTATIFAYEEPLPRHIFPSEEFEHRRRDIDSIYYGRGII